MRRITKIKKPGGEATAPISPKYGASITTAIHIPREMWTLLRAVAFRRAQESGGRASVSKVIAQMIDRCRPDLEKELSIDDPSIDKPSIRR
jgi:hypothetical protein